MTQVGVFAFLLRFMQHVRKIQLNFTELFHDFFFKLRFLAFKY